MLAERLALNPPIPIILLTALMLMLPFQASVEAAKRKSGPVASPELRIITVKASPDPYTPGVGVVAFNIEVELPRKVDEGTLLEVSSLISSPSMSSMRFLAVRQTMSSPSSDEVATPSQPGSAKPRVSVTLSWDGMDQSKQLAESGRYQYEVRAKLLAVGENGPRTHMNSWPKRGRLAVK